MDKELATEKQMTFMKSLGVEIPENVSKQEARFIIDRAVSMKDPLTAKDAVKPIQPFYCAGVPQETKVSKPNGTAAMYVSYAKDIFCTMASDPATLTEDMNKAIELVKQAKEAFE